MVTLLGFILLMDKQMETPPKPLEKTYSFLETQESDREIITNNFLNIGTLNELGITL